MKNHQIGSQINGSAPSSTSAVRQPQAPRSAPVIGAAPATANGWHKFQYALARARSVRGNQLASSTRVAGKTPLSATPRKNRITLNCPTFTTRPQPIAQIAQQIRKMLTIFRALQWLAR